MALNLVFKNSLNIFKLVQKPLIKNPARLFVANGLPALNKKEVKITFIKSDGRRIETKGKIGESLLDVVVNNSVDIDGFGACEGTLTCSTCHLIFKQEDYDSLTEEKTAEESDMLELASELTSTSRLGCQIILNEKMDGLEVQVPAEISDLRE